MPLRRDGHRQAAKLCRNLGRREQGRWFDMASGHSLKYHLICMNCSWVMGIDDWLVKGLGLFRRLADRSTALHGSPHSARFRASYGRLESLNRRCRRRLLDSLDLLPPPTHDALEQTSSFPTSTHLSYNEEMRTMLLLRWRNRGEM